MLPDLPDPGLLMISLLAIAGLAILCLALMVVGGLVLARSLAERLPVRSEGAPLPIRRRQREAKITQSPGQGRKVGSVTLPRRRQPS